MRPAHEWTEADIDTLISDQVPESLSLEYKAAAALSKTEDKKKIEVGKDVSAMANSAGGVIIYGIGEQKNSSPRYFLDPFSPSDFSVEWLDQVIDSNISRRVPGFRIKHIEIAGTGGKVVCVVSIPQSNVAPHMAKDHIFYKRTELRARPMEEYEVRDVGRRMDSPDLTIELRAEARNRDSIRLSPHICNSTTAPALYASIRLFIPDRWSDIAGYNSQWRASDRFQIDVQNVGTYTFKSYFFGWAVPNRPAILSDYPYACDDLLFGSSSNGGFVCWEVSSPNMDVRRGVFTLSSDNGFGLLVIKNPNQIQSISRT